MIRPLPRKLQTSSPRSSSRPSRPTSAARRATPASGCRARWTASGARWRTPRGGWRASGPAPTSSSAQTTPASPHSSWRRSTARSPRPVPKQSGRPDPGAPPARLPEVRPPHRIGRHPQLRNHRSAERAARRCSGPARRAVLDARSPTPSANRRAPGPALQMEAQIRSEARSWCACSRTTPALPARGSRRCSRTSTRAKKQASEASEQEVQLRVLEREAQSLRDQLGNAACPLPRCIRPRHPDEPPRGCPRHLARAGVERSCLPEKLPTILIVTLGTLILAIATVATLALLTGAPDETCVRGR